LKDHLKRFVAISLVILTYWQTSLPQLSNAEHQALSQRFSFTRERLPELQSGVSQKKNWRAVRPSLQHITALISSVGAAVALNDIDGNGFPDDVCYVDTRTDQVIVAPVPGTMRHDPSFVAFALQPSPLPYDSFKMAPMGCLPGDFNEDGLMDILVYYWGRAPILFLRKPSAAGERQAALSADAYARVELVPSPERWFTNAATQADLDGDGHVDLIIG